MATLLLLPLLTFVAANKDHSGETTKDASGVNDGLPAWNDKLPSAPPFRLHHHPLSLKNSTLDDGSKIVSLKSATSLRRQVVRALNGSQLSMECPPAEHLVRTHMAPDFETPQLVRKLDWFHEGSLVASFQQDVVTGVSEEWWVASTRYELQRPFYRLRVSPLLAADSGEYRCWLETDPLFAQADPSFTNELIVQVKPLTPTKPQVLTTFNIVTTQAHESGLIVVTLRWNHSTGEAHRPILHYSVLISRVDEIDSIRVLTTNSNRTSTTVSDLQPNTQYVFSVRAENIAGESAFGPETVFRTPPKTPKVVSKIVTVKNQTAAKSNGAMVEKSACVEVEWSVDFDDTSEKNALLGYKLIVKQISVKELHDDTKNSSGKKSPRVPIDDDRLPEDGDAESSRHEWYVKGESRRRVLCALKFAAVYRLELRVDLGFGAQSPPAVTTFHTAESVPAGPPELIVMRPITAGTLMLSWLEPSQPNGRIVAYQIYLREKPKRKKAADPNGSGSAAGPGSHHHPDRQHSPHQPPTLIRLLVEPQEASKSFAYNLTPPNTVYEIRLTASTLSGESNRSNPIFVRSDRAAPRAPTISNIQYRCVNSMVGPGGSIRVEWTSDIEVNKPGSKNETSGQGSSVSPSEDGSESAGTDNSDESNPLRFYRVQFDETKRKFTLNSSDNSIEIDNLEPNKQYVVRVSAALQSRFDKSSFLYSAYSKAEMFRIGKEKCLVHSTLCAPILTNRNCRSISVTASDDAINLLDADSAAAIDRRRRADSSSVSLVLLFFGMATTLVLSLASTCFLKRHCVFLKSMLKKKKKHMDVGGGNGRKIASKKSSHHKLPYQNGAISSEKCCIMASEGSNNNDRSESKNSLPQLHDPLPNMDESVSSSLTGRQMDAMPNPPPFSMSPLFDLSQVAFGRTVTVVDFDDYYDELAANNNDAFRRQFQELQSIDAKRLNFVNTDKATIYLNNINATSPLPCGGEGAFSSANSRHSLSPISGVLPTAALATADEEEDLPTGKTEEFSRRMASTPSATILATVPLMHSRKNRYVNICAFEEHSRIRIRGRKRRKTTAPSPQLNGIAKRSNAITPTSATIIRSPDSGLYHQSDNTNALDIVVDSENDDDDGYINANYVDSCDEPNTYIATQAPLPHTFDDFWAMVWQEKCAVIVMITNLVESGQVPLTFGDVEVTMTVERMNTFFAHRIFTIRRIVSTSNSTSPSLARLTAPMTNAVKAKYCKKSADTYRTIHQLHFTSWPDHDVPDTVFPLLYFINYVAEICALRSNNSSPKPGGKANSVSESADGPVVVHCSAGVGRSGSFILIDSMRRHLLHCDRINIQAHLRHIRRQRSHLVQTVEQYIFCHDAVRQLIRHGVTLQSAANFPSYLDFLFNQFLPDSLMMSANGQPPMRRVQHQFETACWCPHQPHCLPLGFHGVDGKKECVVLPGYHSEDEFLVAGWPSECAELWSTVWHHKCQTLVLLDRPSDADYFHITSGNFDVGPTVEWKISHSQGQNYTTQTKTNGGGDICNGRSTTKTNGVISSACDFLTTQMLSNCGGDVVRVVCGSEEELLVRVIRAPSSVIESGNECCWREIERIQNARLHHFQRHPNRAHAERQRLMVVDPLWCCGGGRSVAAQLSPTLGPPKGSVFGGEWAGTAFVLCVLQSLACQMEEEGFVDVLLFLTAYQRQACGCWSSQSNINYIYTRMLELINLQR